MPNFLSRTFHHPVVKNATSTVGWLTLAVAMVAPFEGLYTHPYRDAVGVLTVCYGATAADHVDLTRTYTPDECKQMLGNDLPKYDAEIKKCLSPQTYDRLPPHRHAALVSFVYNLGPRGFCNSIAPKLNADKVEAACGAMLAYDHAGGRKLAGLTRRREAEHDWCLRSD